MVCILFFGDWALIPQYDLIIGQTPRIGTMQKGPVNSMEYGLKCVVHEEKPINQRTK